MASFDIANIHCFLRYLHFWINPKLQSLVMKFTKHTLKKIEDLFDELDYEIIYGKGNFQSGYCVVENQNKVVINRYFEVEARINCLLDILSNMTIPEGVLSEKSALFLRKALLLNREEVQEEPKAVVTEEKME